MPIVIQTEKLSKTYSSQGTQNHIIKNLDLVIYSEDFTVIMGPSGAGKSTLLYLLSGMDRPTLGSVHFAGRDLKELSQDRLALFRRKNCGFVFQQINMVDGMSLSDNVLAPGLLSSRNRRTILARASDLFEQVGLDEATQARFPGQVSGGEAQRAALVRALINSPAVLFADEPTGQLNSSSSTQVLDLLEATHARGQAVVTVTHDVRTAARGTRVLYVRDGTIRGELHLARMADQVPQSRLEILQSFLAEVGW